VAADALMIHLCDMPEIDQAALQTVASAWQAHHADLMQATTPDGRPGHPTVFHRTHFPSLHGLTGDRGAREILKAGAVAPCVLPGLAAVTDLDTPEDWAAWRAENSR
ncbi:MAG: NTP transferase domain-containing protein, partial [Pseudomonadota bacterium]